MREPEYKQCEQEQRPAPESDSRLRIVRAAYPLFAEQGYHAVSMQAIADAIPLNKATLYHHFENKDDLFLAVVRMGMTQLYGHIQNFMREGGSAADQLTRVVLLGFRNSQSEFGRLLSDARIYLSEDQQQLLVERCSDPWTLYESIFTSAVASGELPQIDPTLASTMFVGLIHGQTWSVKTRRIAPPLDDTRARLLVDTLFGGIRAVFGGKTTELLAATCQSQSKLDAAAELAVRSS